MILGALSVGAKFLGRVIKMTDDKAITAGRLEEDQEAALILDHTTFYAEQGGQVGDIGAIQTPTGIFDVTATDGAGNDKTLALERVRK